MPQLILHKDGAYNFYTTVAELLMGLLEAPHWVNPSFCSPHLAVPSEAVWSWCAWKLDQGSISGALSLWITE